MPYSACAEWGCQHGRPQTEDHPHLNALRILEEERAKDREREEAKFLYWTMRRAKRKRPRQ